jgi:class 3 adenylate cyclase
LKVTPHRLATIVFTDISDYTSLMGENEVETMHVLNITRSIHLDRFKKFNCIFHKQIGDGFMAVFNSLGEAVHASAQILNKTTNADIKIRVGIHEGDVIFQDNDVYGDVVNIAAWLKNTSRPDCIYVSESVHRNLANKPGISSSFVEEAKLKNVNVPLKIFHICVDHESLPESLPDEEIHLGQRIYIRCGVLPLIAVAMGIFIYFIIPNIPGLNSTSINPKRIQLPGNSMHKD